MTGIISTIAVQNKKYEYTISAIENSIEVVHFVCTAAKIDQKFLAEDIPALIIDLPQIVLVEKLYLAAQSETVRFRVSVTDKQKIEKKALADGFDSVSDYLRAKALA